MPPWLFRTIAGAVAAVVLVVAYLVGSVTLPSLWAKAVVGQLGGQPGNSVPLGMFYGFTFTFAPLLLAWQCRRRRLPKAARVALAATAVVLTIPNLLTLGVMYGGGPTAVDARALWLTEANWFGTWSQIFMLCGAVCAVAGIALGRTWLRRGREVRMLKAAQSRGRGNPGVDAPKAAGAARAAQPGTPDVSGAQAPDSRGAETAHESPAP